MPYALSSFFEATSSSAAPLARLQRPLQCRPRRCAGARCGIRHFLAQRGIIDQGLDRAYRAIEPLHDRDMRQRPAQGLGEFGEADRHRTDIDHRLVGAGRLLVDDPQIALAQFVRGLRQFGVDDDDVGVGVVDHDLDRLHVHRGIDHRGKAGVERIADNAARTEHVGELVARARAERREIQPGRMERVDQEAALAARQRHGGEAIALGRVGMDKALGGFDQFVEAADPDHALAGRDGVEGLDRAGERAGVRHRGGAPSLGRSELERDDRLAGGPRRLAGLAEHLGVAHAFQINHDDADRGIGGEIGHQIRRFEAGLVAGGDHVADADAAILERLADRHHDRPGLAGDRDRPGLHGDDAVVDIGEQPFAGTEVAEAIRAGHGHAGVANGLLQFDRKPLAFRVLQFAEARGDDGRRAGAGRCGVADHLNGETGGHQHQHMVGLVGQDSEIPVAGNAPDGFAPGIDRIEAAFELVFDQIVPDALGVISRLVGGADQHDVARMQHRMNAFDDVARLRRRRPFAGRTRAVDLSFHRRNPYPSFFLLRNDERDRRA